MIRSYGPPLVSYLVKTRGLSVDTAEELLQNFLLEKLIEPAPEKNIASQFLKRKESHPEIRFRNYLRCALKNYLFDLFRKQGQVAVNLDDVGEQAEDPEHDGIDEFQYNVSWANGLLNQACLAVRTECHLKQQSEIWEIFYERLIRPIETGLPAASYEDLCSSGRFESPKKAANFLMTAIRKFNRVLRNLVGNYLPSEGNIASQAIEAELLELQRSLSTPGMLHLQKHADFSVNDSVNSFKLKMFSISDEVTSLWSDADLKNLWRSLLGGSLSSMLEEITGRGPDVRMTATEIWNAPLETLLVANSPNLSVLKAIKDVAKLHASQTSHSLGIDANISSVFPPSVTMLLYGLSIGLARVRLNERLTRDRDEQFVPRVCRLLEFSWIDDQTRNLLTKWLALLQE
ncbi:MAG: hypothetical protein U0996_21910 [Planctomycetaceae bacterium]